MQGVQAAVSVDADVDVVADCIADGANATQVFGNDTCQRSRFVASRQAVLADSHLQVAETALDPLRGGQWQCVAVQEAKAECGIGRHGVRAPPSMRQRGSPAA